jgi:hypothetical protein
MIALFYAFYLIACFIVLVRGVPAETKKPEDLETIDKVHLLVFAWVIYVRRQVRALFSRKN